MFAPGATDFRIHDDFGMGKEDVEVKGSIFIFVTKIISYVMGLREHGVYWLEIDEGFIDGVDKVL